MVFNVYLINGSRWFHDIIIDIHNVYVMLYVYLCENMHADLCECMHRRMCVQHA